MRKRKQGKIKIIKKGGKEKIIVCVCGKRIKLNKQSDYYCEACGTTLRVCRNNEEIKVTPMRFKK